MGRGVDNHTVKVGLVGSSVGETVSFTAECLGTVLANGGAKEADGLDYTYYRLPDGTFRVHVEKNDVSMLVPSNMFEAISKGQRNNFSYGRMTLEELKLHKFDFWPGYEGLIKNHPDTVRNID
jgi:hypothetical protein